MQDFARISDDDLLAQLQSQGGPTDLAGRSAPGMPQSAVGRSSLPSAPDYSRMGDDDLLAQLQPKSTVAATSPAPASASAPRQERGILPELGRQVGLAARYGLEGTAQAAQILTEPLRQNITDPAARALGFRPGKPLGQAASDAADAIGLPTPETSRERIVGEASRLVAGSGVTMGAGGAAAKLPGVGGKIGEAFASGPLQQAASAAAAGAAGGSVREAGGNELAQAGAAMLAGVGGGLGAEAASQFAGRVTHRIMAARGARVDEQIAATLQRAGIDLEDIPDAVLKSLRADARQAVQTGKDLDPEALRRLADFRRVPGATPTRGTLTLDPVQLTREKNLAKSGANATDAGLQGLARVENENNAALVKALNMAGAGTADDVYTVGEKAIGSLQRGLDAEKGTVNQLYQRARDSSGRSFPLDGSTFTRTANQALDDALLGHALPPSVATHLNRIAKGEVPFTVDYAEQLKTAIGNLRRATTDGQTRLALDKVRQALDDTPVLGPGQQTFAPGARAVNPGNLPVVPGAPDLGEDAIRSFNQARAANRAMMQRIERNPALKAIYDGEVAPEDFVRRFVVGQGANVVSVRRLGQELAKDPDAQQAIRSSVAAWLKESAVGKGVTDETARFNALRYNRALATIGDRKLQALGFSGEDIEQLKAVGRVGIYTTHQPVGSAVNNSNSGALLLGRGFDAIDAIAAKLPLLNIGPQISAVTRTVQQRQAQDVGAAIARQQLPGPGGQPALPAVTFGGLFALPGIDQRQDEQRP